MRLLGASEVVQEVDTASVFPYKTVTQKCTSINSLVTFMLFPKIIMN